MAATKNNAAATTLRRMGGWWTVKRVAQLVLGWVVVCGALGSLRGDVERFAISISSLVDPAKLATLGARAANPRVEKYVVLLAEAKAVGIAPGKVAAEAVALVGMKGKAGKLTAEAMVRNLAIAERLGCLDADGLAEMHRGQAPTVRRGPYRGERLSVDHIIPLKVVPELDNVIANLEFMPLKIEKHQDRRATGRSGAKASQGGATQFRGLAGG